MSALTLLLEILLLLALPLGLRCAAAWKMRRIQEAVRRSDEEFRSLRAELDALAEECRRTDRQVRQHQLRRSRLLSRVDAARVELERLRQPVPDRLAA